MSSSGISIALTVATPGALPSAFVVYRDPLSVTLPKAAELGYDGVELALLNRSQIDMAELKSLLSGTGLRVPMVSTGQVFAAGQCCFAAADFTTRRKAEELFTGLIDVAAELGSMINCGRVRGPVEGNGTRSEVEKRVAESFSRLSGRAKSVGVQMVLEPVNRYEIDLLNSCGDSIDFLDRFGLSEIKIMPDVFHMNIEEASIEGSLMKFADRIGYVHFADSNRWYPGAGHLDFSKIVRSMHAAGYTGWVGAEILPNPDPDTAAREAIRYLSRFL